MSDSIPNVPSIPRLPLEEIFEIESGLVNEYIASYIPLVFYTLLYGIEPYNKNQCAYLVLFVTCTYILAHKKGHVKRMQSTAIVALFMLATLGFILSCIYAFLSIKENIMNYFVADTFSFDEVLFIQKLRCYKIWGSKKKFIAFPVFISIINNEVGLLVATNHAMEQIVLLGDDISKSFLIVNFFTNLFIPSMIVGRIWWIGHEVSKFLSQSKQFNFMKYSMAACLESGIMYPLALLPSVVMILLPWDASSSSVYYYPILIQVVGIAPTFIIVRIALGISIENVDDTIRMYEDGGQAELSTWEVNHDINQSVHGEQSTV
ncbi:hypothetical protein K435DRAFT_811256 [Dendrothele bispora CBS 962.96]|uniref:Uncharacterized protein n=1 Tax=Dendrothele bispora (strain CBS 962.96) TaxID=1314807 RepID=A0A4S8KSJ2_DENBC|nr:hypothetical protein K435DRAFT_811256 [Dendrothele bispora CBS 962.96]